MIDKTIEHQLNDAAVKWKTTPCEGNEAVVEQLGEKVFLLAFELFKNYDDGTDDTLKRFEKVLKTYQPENGNLSNYLNRTMKYAKVDHAKRISEQAFREKSLNEIVSDDDERDKYEIMENKNAQDPAKIVDLRISLEELTARILNFSERHRSTNASSTKNMWFQLFFTEDITEVAVKTDITVSNEKEVFRAMRLEYLDYYMSTPCRTLRKIGMTKLKAYEKVIPNCAVENIGKEIKVPLEADVMLAYLAMCKHMNVGRSARSNQRSAYKKMCESIRKELEQC